MKVDSILKIHRGFIIKMAKEKINEKVEQGEKEE